MAFDLGPAFHVDWSAEAQLNEGGTNKFNNCVPAAFATCMVAEGFPDIPPQAWVDAEYGPTFHGGTDFSHAIDFIRHNYPNAPEIRVSNPALTLEAIDAAGIAGFPVVLQCHSDASATFVDHATGMFHMGIPTALSNANGTVTVRNVWWGKEHVLSFDFVKKMTLNPAGWMAVFVRSLVAIPPTPIDACADVKAQLAAAAANLAASTAQLAKWEAWYAGRPR